MNWYLCSIFNCIFIIVFVVNLVIVIVVGFYFKIFLDIGDDYSSLVGSEMVYVLEVQDIFVNFKIQVQEWKNVLIWGDDVGQCEKYWGCFQEWEVEIQLQLDDLILELIDLQVKKLMSQFQCVYK